MGSSANAFPGASTPADAARVTATTALVALLRATRYVELRGSSRTAMTEGTIGAPGDRSVNVA